MKGKAINIYIHVIGSILFLSIPFIISPDRLRFQELFTIPPFLRDVLSNLLLLLFFYANYYFFIPKYYQNRKAVIYILVILLCFLIVELLPRLLFADLHFQRPHIGSMHKIYHPSGNDPSGFPDVPPRNQNFRFVLWLDVSRHFFLFAGVVFFSLLLKISEKLKQAHKEKLNAELLYLKAQINPHFLFNTLNSIYSLAIQKSNDTPNAVVKLSGMMRYVLTESQNEFVSLHKEINYISNYIELQKLRLDKTVKLHYLVNGSIKNQTIAPLVLMPFIENAFKYGVNPEENSDISIEIGIYEAAINLSVKNNMVYVKDDPYNKSGLGIENTRHRLRILYPDKHYLIIEDNEVTFNVSLSIKI